MTFDNPKMPIYKVDVTKLLTTQNCEPIKIDVTKCKEVIKHIRILNQTSCTYLLRNHARVAIFRELLEFIKLELKKGTFEKIKNSLKIGFVEWSPQMHIGKLGVVKNRFCRVVSICAYLKIGGVCHLAKLASTPKTNKHSLFFLVQQMDTVVAPLTL